MPKIGYGTKKELRDIHPDGFKHRVISTVDELNMFLLQNRRVAAVIAAKLSARKRESILKKAKELNIRVVNDKARTRTEETEK